MTKQDVVLPSWVLHTLQQSNSFFEGLHQQAYLVGGSVRNLLLHKPCVDWDIAIMGDTRSIARQLADTSGGFYAPLNERANRVIVRQAQEDLIIDVSPLQGERIEADLQARDFTLNAIAAPFGAVVHALMDDEGTVQTQLSEVFMDSALSASKIWKHRRYGQPPTRFFKVIRYGCCALYALCWPIILRSHPKQSN